MADRFMAATIVIRDGEGADGVFVLSPAVAPGSLIFSFRFCSGRRVSSDLSASCFPALSCALLNASVDGRRGYNSLGGFSRDLAFSKFGQGYGKRRHLFRFRLTCLVDVESQDGDEERGQGLNGDLDMQRIEEPPEDPLFLPGLFSDPGHDSLLEERRRFHFSETMHE